MVEDAHGSKKFESEKV